VNVIIDKIKSHFEGIEKVSPIKLRSVNNHVGDVNNKTSARSQGNKPRSI
jgi:hypothetical protein